MTTHSKRMEIKIDVPRGDLDNFFFAQKRYNHISRKIKSMSASHMGCRCNQHSIQDSNDAIQSIKNTLFLFNSYEQQGITFGRYLQWFGWDLVKMRYVRFGRSVNCFSPNPSKCNQSIWPTLKPHYTRICEKQNQICSSCIGFCVQLDDRLD